MRLLWLTENYPPARGGMAQSCDRIVHSLRHAGVVVDIVHLTRRARQERLERRLAGYDLVWPVREDPAHSLNCLWNRLTAERDRATGEPITHVVAFGGVLPLVAAPVFAAWLRVPLVTMIRGNDFDVGIFNPKRADILHRALESSTRVCAVSRDKVEKIAALYPATEPQWIPNGIDLAQWTPLPSDQVRAAQWRRTIAPPGDEPRRRVLGIFGHIKPKKGGLFFLETLRNSGDRERFHVAFVGELSDEVTAWLTMYGPVVRHSAAQFGDRYDLMWRYLACDLIVLPSFYDGLPNVLLEAGALGVPFVAAVTGGMADFLVDGEHGFLFRPGDAAQCRRALDRASRASDEQLRRCGESCRALVRERLTHELEAQRYLELFATTKETSPVARGTVPIGLGDAS
ncbi:MAG: glycosyltransferase family 4 protein [bacterium]|nr:glycosyltransferase family 4 protein [bacterium]